MPRDLVAVVGMDRPEEEIRIAGLGRLVAEAEDAAGLGRPLVAIVVRVPDPAADARDLLRVVQ